MAPNVHCRGMTNDLALQYLGTAARLARINRFYARRVLQRCERGEIQLLKAAELLMAAANRDGASIEAVVVGSANRCAFTRPRRS